MAKRSGEVEFVNDKKLSSSRWLSRSEEMLPVVDYSRTLNNGSLAEKSPDILSRNGQRSVRTLPFSEKTFHLINRKFFVHHSISAAVSRADIPTFSSADVEMEGPDGEVRLANGMENGNCVAPGT